MQRPPCSAALHACSLAGQSRKCSVSRTPERPALGERGPVARKAHDKAALPRAEPAREERLAAELRRETACHGEVVELAKIVLQHLERHEIRRNRRGREAFGERITCVAQPLHSDAKLMAVGRMLPVHALGLLHGLAMKGLEGLRGEFGARLRRALPERLLHPGKAVQQERGKDWPAQQRSCCDSCLALLRAGTPEERIAL